MCPAAPAAYMRRRNSAWVSDVPSAVWRLDAPPPMTGMPGATRFTAA
jgi:hypothetical protein